MKTSSNSELDPAGRSGDSSAAAAPAPESPIISATSSTLALDSPELYINRELSLLQFQWRVLEQAQDPSNPILERIKFLSIVSSNLDEFFMVRVAGLQNQAASGVQESSVDGLSAVNQLQLIRQEVRKLVDEIQNHLRDSILPALEREGIRIVNLATLSPQERSELDDYFLHEVFPVLTPLAFDPGRPFPHISSGSLNLAVVVGDNQGTENFARLKLPDSLPRLVPVISGSAKGKSSKKSSKSGETFVWLEDLIIANLPLLFPGLEIVEACAFRVTRDAEIAIQELESDDLLESVEEAMKQRRFSSVVRLQVDSNVSDKVLEILASNLPIDKQDVYRISGSIGLGRLMELCALDRPELKDKTFSPSIPPALSPNSNEDIFSVIRREDLLLNHPYESFQPVVEFLQQAARDPNVLAIKVTLYRVGRNSPIVATLLDAIERGKQVSVLVELKARFDEESNIEWARTLEDVGVHVVYGLVGLKVHSKVALVVRREGKDIRRYVHLGTGNYNPSTARAYTDFGFLTCNEKIADDVTYFFNALTGYSRKNEPHELLVAPVNLRQRLEKLILREIDVQKNGGQGRLIFKMNAMEDPQMIQLLFRASQAGVKVDLLVRGLCCLRPSIDGISENIRVSSIVGRFLEHSRVYYFGNGGAEEIYLGSADLMRRNLSHRVEILFPVSNNKLVRRLKDILSLQLSDEKKSHYLQSDGRYIRNSKFEEPDAIDSQLRLLNGESAPPKGGRSLAVLSRKRRAAERRPHPRSEN
jgi:polyphosphate kinase